MKFSKKTEDIIADFRGLPHTVSSSSRREPTTLDNLLVILEDKYHLKKPGTERYLVENWEEIFGSNLYKRCHPLRIKDNSTLIISVANQTLRAELLFKKRAILRRIQSIQNCAIIKDIIVRS